jgi:hypothetical protein
MHMGDHDVVRESTLATSYRAYHQSYHNKFANRMELGGKGSIDGGISLRLECR